MFVTQILVVDDFLPWQRLVSKMLESEPNLKIISFASEGFEAVQKAKELQPDVILMDINLPKLAASKLLDKSARLLRSPTFFS
jgi:two-component system chemotaxis response regulator CheB